MKLNIDPNWLLRMAEKEDNSIVSVGGLRHASGNEHGRGDSAEHESV
jgi:hypothetical protein